MDWFVVLKKVLNWIITLSPIICSLIAGCVSYILARRAFKNEIAAYKSKNIYDHKQQAILNSLNFLDDYLSWLRYEERIPVRKDITSVDLTERGRKCYNELSIYCNRKDLLSSFNNIVFCKDGSKLLKEYNIFRNQARKELDLETLELDSTCVFISCISTKDLEKTNND